jgi:hypothetical protein
MKKNLGKNDRGLFDILPAEFCCKIEENKETPLARLKF